MTAAPDPKLAEAVRKACASAGMLCGYPDCVAFTACKFPRGFRAGRALGLEQAEVAAYHEACEAMAAVQLKTMLPSLVPIVVRNAIRALAKETK